MAHARGVTLSRLPLPLALTTALLSACSSSPLPGAEAPATPARLAPASGAALLACEALVARFAFAETAIASAAIVAAGPAVPNSAPVGAHCLVKGQMRPRKGSDGQDYAIGFEMRLPQAWNGRFYHQANGGIDGVVQPALGALGGGPITGALAQGFA
ncbi:MAG: tannase/feruloyl esterase family alpha/beta hydrolase, partial [Rubrivivax sp.]|nr:tannase/feruloyl esterase family alpha/beta hydrolase [Rubrivivax sp.]